MTKIIFLISLLALTLSCKNESSFNDNSGAQKAPPTTTPAPPTNSSIPRPVEQVAKQVSSPNIDSNGVEAYNQCSECMQRAQQIYQKYSVALNSSNICNMGRYRVSQSSNLCDYHFFSNATQTIDEHQASDVILNNQFVLYCPCDCSELPTISTSMQNCSHRVPRAGYPGGFLQLH